MNRNVLSPSLLAATAPVTSRSRSVLVADIEKQTIRLK